METRTRLVASCLLSLLCAAATAGAAIQLHPLGTYETGIFAGSASEIVAHDPRTQRAFVTNSAAATLDVLDVSNPANPTLAFAIPLVAYGARANSVAVHKKVIAAAVENHDKQLPGSVVFFDADGNFLNQVSVGALPDMLAFSPDGRWLLTANEGEPSSDYSADPEGSVSVIDMHRGAAKVRQEDVSTAGFAAFNGVPLDPSIRIFGPGATVAQDLEPEYLAISDDSKTAYVTLQENNAMAVVDIRKAKVTKLVGLGFKDHSHPDNPLDPSDREDAIQIDNWPVLGMYQPDAIAAYRAPSLPDAPHGPKSSTFLVMANEGDARDYDAFGEESRVQNETLDPVAFPNAAFLQHEDRIGRLRMTTATGDSDGDGDFDAIHSFGARSFSIRDQDGNLVYDSGGDLEQRLALELPADFNCTNDANGSFDTRSDDKGPEPEGLILGRFGGRTYVFLALERIGGIAVYDITDPQAPTFEHYINTRDFGGSPALGTAGDLAPEGLAVVEAKKSPTGRPLLLVAYEVSGTTSIYEIDVQ